jgi:hypothetical protein
MHPFCKYAPQNDILPEQMYYKFSQLAMIDLGTECKLSPECGLARGNIQWPGVLDLFRKPNILIPPLSWIS